MKLEPQGRIARSPGKLVEPTEEERKAGWTAETLTAYVQQREAAQFARIDPASEARRKRPKEANHRYSPFRWRG